MSKKIKYKRDLTDEEQSYIKDLTTRSPRLAVSLSKTLREQSFRKGGRTYFFSTGDEKEEDDFYSFKKKIPKRKRIKFPKKCKGKLVMSK